MPDYLSENSPRLLDPQCVVLVSPVSGLPYSAKSMVTDDAGAAFNLEACSHTYTYSPDGNLATDTASDGEHSWTKTYSYTSGNLSTETKWVKQ